MIAIENVTKVHRRGQTDVHALRGVTCEIADGSFTFIVGPSGSGKSTLLHLIGALDEPTGGTIRFQGSDLAAFSPAQRDAYRRDQVGFIFQNFNLLANLSAVDNVTVPFMPQGISQADRDRAQALLEQVGLADRLTHRPYQMSGGEQQRVAIARALFKQPSLVLADEPTGELDTATGAEVFGHLRRLHADFQATIVIVTHDRATIQPGDRVIEVRDGRLVDS